MLATDPLPAARFQRLGRTARGQLRRRRMAELRAAEAAHRTRYPRTLEHLGAMNLHLERVGSAGCDPTGARTSWELVP